MGNNIGQKILNWLGGGNNNSPLPDFPLPVGDKSPETEPKKAKTAVKKTAPKKTAPKKSTPKKKEQ